MTWGPQPLQLAKTVTADAGGMAVADFDSVAQSHTWTAAAQVLGAPNAASFSAVVAGQQWGSWAGPVPYLLQAHDRDTVQIVMLGLAPGRVYVCTLTGVATDSDSAPTITPSAAPGGIITAGNEAESVLCTSTGGTPDHFTLIADPLPNQSIVLYTLALTSNAEPGGAFSCQVNGGKGLLQIRDGVADSLYYGGFIVTPGAGLTLTLAGYALNHNARANATYQLAPAAA